MILPLLQSAVSQERLHALASEMRLDETLLLELVKAAERHSGMLRRKGLFQAFDAIIDRAVK
ncbi:hypothetical protein QWJ46_04450 [Rhizobium sp. CBN3]|uniref:DNA modification system-associated small protein n=1 Tax=Rhizobium sp. CBN3 TaxID=3058045 RepID=UPI002672C661|nr:DNA modification system-associated small protein [Rhizobium sp. CBN3]MDO3431926.1 hypothetical protein [Rhizobium sp. CBN3]